MPGSWVARRPLLLPRPLGTDYIKEATEGISIAVKILADVAGNAGAVVGYFIGGLAAAGVE